MVDIARSPEVKRKKQIRRIIYGAVALVAIVLITVGVSRLRPAAPGVDRATVWIDTVKRGPMIRQVRGSGILVPENIRWITATTSGRVERLVLRPGATVTPTTVILEMSNPDLQQSVMEAAARLPLCGGDLRESQGRAPEPVADAGGWRHDDGIPIPSGEPDARGERRAVQGKTDLRASVEAVPRDRAGPEEPAVGVRGSASKSPRPA